MDWTYLGTAGYLGYSLPGFTQGKESGNVNIFLQSDPVFRVRSSEEHTRWAGVRITALSGWTDMADHFDISLQVYLEGEGDVYVPLREALSPLVQRRLTGLLASPLHPAAVCEVVVSLMDVDYNVIGAERVIASVYDAVGDQNFRDWRGLGLPDSWRVMSGNARNYFCLPCGHNSGNQQTLVFRHENGTKNTFEMPDDGSTLAFGFTSSLKLAQISIHDTVGYLAATRVVWETCGSDKLLLRWWSPLLGCWKTCVADVIGGLDDVTEREEMLRGFGMVDGVAATLGYSLRFPLLTYRDWLYFRDIAYSDEVYIDQVDNVAYGGSSQDAARPVRVAAQAGGWRLDDVKDFEFAIKYDYIREI